MLEILTKDELAGVLSHELAHIRSRDALTMTISVTIVGAIAAIFAPLILVGRYMRSGKVASIIIVATIALLAAAILQLMLSRSREFEADKSGAMICGHPEWLASALLKLASAAKEANNLFTLKHLASAPLNIVDPIPHLAWSRLFEMHPPIEHRIAQLKLMACSQKNDRHR